jgi:hypothetical protein
MNMELIKIIFNIIERNQPIKILIINIYSFSESELIFDPKKKIEHFRY